MAGLSGILCARPVLSLADEPVAEDDGELGLCLKPLARRSFPFLGRVVQHQILQLHGRIGAAQLGVQRLYGVRNRIIMTVPSDPRWR